jgi:hypothetical protein
MPEHVKAGRDQRADTKHSLRHHLNKDVQTIAPENADNSVRLIGETPFQPPVQRHTELMSSAQSNLQRGALVADLQQSYGNRYVAGLIGPVPKDALDIAGSVACTANRTYSVSGAGLADFDLEDRDIVLGGDYDDEEYTDDEDATESPVEETAPDADISAKTNLGPLWDKNGYFLWGVSFNTTGRNGWIVQEIINTYDASDDNGNVLDAKDIDAHYWEAWKVDASGKVSPQRGADNDEWVRPERDKRFKGMWTTAGNVFFTNIDPESQGFASGNANNAHILLSTTSCPNGLGVARLTRNASGIWNEAGHAGSVM